jgi:3-oxoacyl-[acyl-carrier protein] reductase
MRRFALITGGSKGLGACLVRRFWLDGYSLIVVARHSQNLLNIVDDLHCHTDQSAEFFCCDLADPNEISTLIASIKAKFTRLDVLVNNAAIQGPIGPLCENELDAWQQTLQINLFAPVALCRGLIPLMKRGGGSSIINLSGGGATAPRAYFSAYATAKAGLVRFSETIADELKADGIRVNCIAPGAMNTSMLTEVLAKKKAAGFREYSLAMEVIAKGGASMENVADLALFLARDSSLGITGKLISAVWDNWEEWSKHLNDISQSDVYTLRRITGRDRGFGWGDK